MWQRLAFCFVYLRWDSSTVVFFCDAVVDVESDFYVSAVSGQCFVYRIINYLKDEMVESSLCGIADIHSRTFAYRFESFKDFNLACSVILIEHSFLKNKFIKLLFSFCDASGKIIIYDLLSKQDFKNNIILKQFLKLKNPHRHNYIGKVFILLRFYETWASLIFEIQGHFLLLIYHVKHLSQVAAIKCSGRPPAAASTGRS